MNILDEFSMEWEQKQKEFADRFEMGILGREPKRSFKERVETYHESEPEEIEEPMEAEEE